MTDCEFLLGVLADGEEHTLNEILMESFRVRGCGITVHSRAADLRRRGYEVVNRHDGTKKRGAASVYRLVGRPEAASSVSSDAASGSPHAATGEVASGRQTTVWDFV